MVPRGSWIAEQLRFRHFVANHEPFPTINDAWEAFKKQDSLFYTEDPLFKRWQSLVENNQENKNTSDK